ENQQFQQEKRCIREALRVIREKVGSEAMTVDSLAYSLSVHTRVPDTQARKAIQEAVAHCRGWVKPITIGGKRYVRRVMYGCSFEQAQDALHAYLATYGQPPPSAEAAPDVDSAPSTSMSIAAHPVGQAAGGREARVGAVTPDMGLGSVGLGGGGGFGLQVGHQQGMMGS
ncbi:hypothetical protein KIPB_012094, partial [Kipferlia bialata]